MIPVYDYEKKVCMKAFAIMKIWIFKHEPFFPPMEMVRGLLSTCLFGFKLTCAYMYIVIMCHVMQGTAKSCRHPCSKIRWDTCLSSMPGKKKKQTPCTMVWSKCSPYPFRYLAFGKSAPI